MGSILESWLYADAAGTRSIRVSENGSDWYTFTITTTATVRRALDELELQLNASGDLAFTYTVAFAESLNQVRFGASSAFHLELLESMPQALGFASGSLGSSLSHLSSTPPGAILAVSGAQYTAPQPVAETEFNRYSWGRSRSFGFAYGRSSTVTVIDEAANIDALVAGMLFQGRMRVSPDSAVTTAYDVTNLTGYLDLDPFEHGQARVFGVADGFKQVSMTGMVV
ncbi:MAG: hypothetical protein ACYTFV_02585 [Planctomycetota bacterium]|jgi:hypothetical protein